MNTAVGIMPDSKQKLMEKFGVKYWEPGEVAIHKSGPGELYSYSCFIGKQEVIIDRGDSFAYINGDQCHWVSGPASVYSSKFGVMMIGYTPPYRSADFPIKAYLPYVNGCATAQIFPPLRAGDPTLQWLDIPPFSAEQAHHIHSTVRCVYIAAGKGRSIVGMESGEIIEELYEGKTIVLDPMCPHHFDTPQGEHLICVPFHVYSSTSAEFRHPMFLGTHLMNQGE